VDIFILVFIGQANREVKSKDVSLASSFNLPAVEILEYLTYTRSDLGFTARPLHSMAALKFLAMQ